MLICQEIKDKYQWDSFITSQPHHTFLHSWAWGEFNEQMGDRVWRLGIYFTSSPTPLLGKERGAHNIRLNRVPPSPYQGEGGQGGEVGGSRGGDPELIAVALVIKVHAKRGNFLFIPQGPVGDKGTLRPPRGGGGFLKALKLLARREKVNFIRISPLLGDTAENKAIFKNLGFRPAPIHMHAETTWTLDLTPSEEELLMGMRKTTRNLIRRAIKEGVEIKMGTSAHDIETFNNLYKETVLKHSFTPFSPAYLQKQVEILSKGNNIRVFTALYENQPLASAIIVFYGNSAFYHHGASSPTKYQKIPSAYLLQWEAIREAKRRGHKFYNFWGIINSHNTQQTTNNKHPWAGLTLFKTGFGGFETHYLHAQDLALSWKYWPNWIIETIRRKRRNL